MSKKIPSTIRKAAEDTAIAYANKAHATLSYQAAYSDGYLACYEKLMEGGPSGYAAVNRDGDFMLATVAYDSFHAAAILHDQLDASGVDFDEKGWSVVPVKVIKIDEEPKP